VVDGAGQRHVDGGILNNLPIGAGRRCSDGRVVAISLDPDPNGHPPPGPSPAATGAGLGRTIIDALMCGSHAAGQAEERLADVLLRPDILRFPFLDWSQHRAIHAEGYRAAKQRLQHGWPVG
jgi:NTE family protein